MKTEELSSRVRRNATTVAVALALAVGAGAVAFGADVDVAVEISPSASTGPSESGTPTPSESFRPTDEVETDPPSVDPSRSAGSSTGPGKTPPAGPGLPFTGTQVGTVSLLALAALAVGAALRRSAKRRPRHL
jgi:hypothetical protein